MVADFFCSGLPPKSPSVVPRNCRNAGPISLITLIRPLYFLRQLSFQRRRRSVFALGIFKIKALSNSTSRASESVSSKSASVSPGKPTMMSVVMPMPGRTCRNFSMILTNRSPRNRGASISNKAVAATLQGECARPISATCRKQPPSRPRNLSDARGKANAFQAVQRMNRFQQLHKSRFAILHRNIALAIARHNLPASNFALRAILIPALGHNSVNAATLLFAARVWDDAKRIILVATCMMLTKRRSRIFPPYCRRECAPDHCFAARFLAHVHDFVATSGENLVQIIRR